jgi:plastocyanin
MRTVLDDRRVLLPVLLTAVAIAIGSVLIVMLSSDASSGSASAPATASAATAAGGARTVDIADFKYEPVTVTVKAGSKVSWVNHDGAPHTATAAGSDGFDTGTLKKGDRRTLTLARAGTYAYVCEFHPFMKATVVVR